MRVLCLVDCYLPSTKSSAKLVHDLACEFARRGHQVCLAAPDDSLQLDCQVTCEEGLIIARIRTGKIKGAGLLRRGYNEVRLSAVMWKRGKKFFRQHPCDLVVFYSPTIFFGPLVAQLKRLNGGRAYLILRDIFPQWALDSGILRPGLVTRYFCFRERQQYLAADFIGVQSPANLRHFQVHPLPSGRDLEVLFNWTALAEDTPATRYRSCLGLQNKVVFFYGGNMGVAQDMDNILRLAAAAADCGDIHFVLMGEGSEVPRLMQRVARERLTNISLLPAVPQEEYLGVVSEFDVGLITLDRHLKTHNFPGKMLSYMYHGKPILASINAHNDLREIIEASRAGLVCLNGENEQFLQFALRLARNCDLRKEMGRNARALLERLFSVRAAADQILSHVECPKPATVSAVSPNNQPAAKP